MTEQQKSHIRAEVLRMAALSVDAWIDAAGPETVTALVNIYIRGSVPEDFSDPRIAGGLEMKMNRFVGNIDPLVDGRTEPVQVPE